MDRLQTNPRLLEFQRLIPDSVGIAMRAADAADFLSWVRDQLLVYATFDSPVHDNPTLARALAFAWTRAVWNGLPLNCAGVRPTPLREPGGDDSCPCGSGRKFKLCCLPLPEVPTLTPEVLWPYVLANMRTSDRDAWLAANRISRGALIEFAAHLLERQRNDEVIAALEPRLATPERYNDEDTAILLDLLCDAYGTSEKGTRSKLRMLEMTTQKAPRSPLRGEAWQRLATIYMDQGDPTRAWSAFHCATEDNPQADTLCVLEVELLAAEHRMDEAREHAKFWLERLERASVQQDDPRIEFLRRMASDATAPLRPATALQGVGSALSSWLARVAGRSLPAYTLDAQGSRLDAQGSRLEARGGQCVLAPPAVVVAVERQWREVFPLEKPFALQDQLFGGVDIWEEHAQNRWSQFLESHPECFDSVEILDDLATAIGRHPQAGSREVEIRLLAPILERSAAIVEHACRNRGATLAWTSPRNRAALRSVVRLVRSHLGRRDREKARALGKWLLQINPADEHGMSELLQGTAN
jgi:tetratricopeptide (TPR) repeat protein